MLFTRAPWQSVCLIKLKHSILDLRSHRPTETKRIHNTHSLDGECVTLAVNSTQFLGRVHQRTESPIPTVRFTRTHNLRFKMPCKSRRNIYRACFWEHGAATKSQSCGVSCMCTISACVWLCVGVYAVCDATRCTCVCFASLFSMHEGAARLRLAPMIEPEHGIIKYAR